LHRGRGLLALLFCFDDVLLILSLVFGVDWFWLRCRAVLDLAFLKALFQASLLVSDISSVLSNDIIFIILISFFLCLG
jgi:hypothetical protein